MDLKLAFQFLKNMGVRYTSYRIKHFVEQKTGILKKRHPLNPVQKNFISLNDWKKLNPSFIFSSREMISEEKFATDTLKEKAERILNYEIQFFNNDWLLLGKNYDWITNPETNFKYNIDKHWSEINDFNLKNGDIKYVWEKSRFTYFLTIIRYDYHFNEDHSEFIFKEIESWIKANPINQGPNWKCSQEISLRTFNWLYALYFYKDSPFLTESLWQKIQHVFYWQMHHVFHHINFSRIAVRNNHAITETLALTLIEILFPFFPEANLWSKKGREYFEKEIDYQIYSDGAFIQHSMNYHRVLIQLLNFGLYITQKANKPFSKTVYDKAHTTLNFLFQFVQPENGKLPNYGANDGALFFPLADANYRDYRPSLNTLHQLLTGKNLFYDNSESFFKPLPILFSLPPLKQEMGCVIFEASGYYLFKQEETFTFIKCSSYKDRPAHADNLHIDIWHKGENIFRDGGSYKYNTTPEWTDFFSGTKSHNTVMIEDKSQMLKGSRFIWFYWTKALKAKVRENNFEFIFEGTIKAFSHVNKKIKHTRRVIIHKKENRWEIQDKLVNSKKRTAFQIWNHKPDALVEIKAKIYKKTLDPVPFKSFYSSKYGSKKKQLGTSFAFQKYIETEIKLLQK